MILIVSSSSDVTTHKVCEWLIFKGKNDFVVINEINAISSIEIHFSFNGRNKTVFYLESGHKLNVEQLKSVWYRRGDFFKDTLIKNETIELFSENLNQEWNSIKEFLLHEIQGISNFRFTHVNKLRVLHLASKLGLNIPETIVCTSKKSLLNYFTNRRVINKPISQCMNKVHEEKVVQTRTIEIDSNQIPSYFFPSKFQELVPKKYELRVFFFAGKYYTMAIFSQLDKQTEIDFRNYNYQKPNRAVPYVLPKGIENKLTMLLRMLNLDTASIDLIVTDKNQFVFLEVNPVGQFGMVSEPCNFRLEEKIAEYLIKLDENEKNEI